MPRQTSAVLLVGNCGPDEGKLRALLYKRFSVDIDATMYVEQALAMMRSRSYHLVLFNRLIYADDSPGIDLLMRAKADLELQETPIMMISNLADAQAQSVAAGGEPGFGKDDIEREETVELLSRFLRGRSPDETA